MPGTKRSGRSRKPTQLRVIEGNRSRAPIPKEVQPTGDAVKPKRFKSSGERKAWDLITPPLFECGLATNADQVMLEKLCYWFAEHEKYAAYNQDDFGKAERAWKQFERIAARFGMTPSDRAGLDVSKSKPQDDTERFLA